MNGNGLGNISIVIGLIVLSSSLGELFNVQTSVQDFKGGYVAAFMMFIASLGLSSLLSSFARNHNVFMAVATPVIFVVLSILVLVVV